MEKKHRRLVVDGCQYAWVGDWRYTAGVRVVRIRAWFQTEDDKKVGPMLSVNLVGKGHGMVDCSAAMPRDARAAILLARKLGWSPEGRGTFWILPMHGLELETLEVVAPEPSSGQPGLSSPGYK
ncbi:hypothetical protein [Vitiosangium sp. GDMCC 1.1324]|uniref:hypothetical protein n=1 Tax=Vitiosangium sp. (strain GDMCC 1.1324) TaxID=2138576 RepID=UPI000D367482|nr:hypothetical protein [Vitiosangium sp. GDMCC 1.1324]PTL75586.1 hypothetical protein DAT35_54205 [Vitiosangium sp. GDMCC 1.1324]